MVKKQVIIADPDGLHARPASDFVKCATSFGCRISVGRVGTTESANAKSMISVLSLGLVEGTLVEISADGEQEQQALDALVALLEKRTTPD